MAERPSVRLLRVPPWAPLVRLQRTGERRDTEGEPARRTSTAAPAPSMPPSGAPNGSYHRPPTTSSPPSAAPSTAADTRRPPDPRTAPTPPLIAPQPMDPCGRCAAFRSSSQLGDVACNSLHAEPYVRPVGGPAVMTEEKPRYDVNSQRRRDLDGVQHVGDVIQQMIEDGPWRHLAPAVRDNGSNDHDRRDRHSHG